MGKLTRDHIVALNTAMNERSVLLEELDISNNKLDNVEPSLLTSVVSKMKKVKMMGVKLTVEHIVALSTALNERGVPLKELDISHNDLNYVDSNALALVASSMEKIRMT